MGVAATPAPKGLGPQNPTKKLGHVGVLLGPFLSQNRVPKLLDPGQWTPLKYWVKCVRYYRLSSVRTELLGSRIKQARLKRTS